MSNNNLSFAFDVTNCQDINECIDAVNKNSCQCVLPLFHPRLRRDVIGVSDDRIYNLITRSDTSLSCNDWCRCIIGKISEWIDCDDARNRNTSLSSEKALQQEIEWAIHLGLQTILLPSLKCFEFNNYARIVTQLTKKLPLYSSFLLKVPLTIPMTYRSNSSSNSNSNSLAYEDDDGWKLWDKFRFLSNHNHRISVALEFQTVDIYSCMDDETFSAHTRLLHRWVAEPLKAIILPLSLFVLNSKGYPVLSKQMQTIMKMMLQYKVTIIFTQKLKHFDSYTPYIQYIMHLHSHIFSNMTEDERISLPYKDTLQSPLQPLADNLESQVYETFERDPIKYNQYEKAIEAALQDIYNAMGKWKSDVIVTVVGAGRGPLIKCAINASSTKKIPIRINAIEKNKNAIITLKNRIRNENWSSIVTLFSEDMRYFDPPELSDLLVSELLGSLGDNELSPECLDGAQKCLKPNGISIPSSSTSFIAPIATSKLWMCARDVPRNTGDISNGLNSPYVVLFHNYNEIAAAKPLFTFDHPNHDSFINNNRYASISFDVQDAVTIHGFSGYFEAVLYKDVMLSIVPYNHTPNMFSWFPLFIPLTKPVRVNPGDTISIDVWRCVDARKVYYSWGITAPVINEIQNSTGEAYHIGI